MRPYSPNEKPQDFDKAEKVLERLSNLDFLGDQSVFLTFHLKEKEGDEKLSEARSNGIWRADKIKVFSDDSVCFTGIKSTPKKIMPLIQPPCPYTIEIYFGPRLWTDWNNIEELCRLVPFYRTSYWISINDDFRYFLSKKPDFLPIYVACSGDATPIVLPYKNNVPLPCVNHEPYVTNCSKRFNDVSNIFNDVFKT